MTVSRSRADTTAKALVEAAGENAETVTLDVRGMKCAGCVKAVERQLANNPHVCSARVNLATEVAIVTYRSGAVEPAEFAEKLRKRLKICSKNAIATRAKRSYALSGRAFWYCFPAWDISAAWAGWAIFGSILG